MTNKSKNNSRKFINYAHRGASEYCPENTFLSFYTGIFMRANGIETDVQKTKDGVLVLFHDGTLDRVTGNTGKISDYTYGELRDFFVTKDGLSDKIVKLEDFLERFAFCDITFAVELKQKDIERETADLIKKYGIADRTVITSFDFVNLMRSKEYAPELNAGYLTGEVTDEILKKMKSFGVEEICPSGSKINKKLVDDWHDEGFNVRAWGIYSEEIMKHVYDCGADGMTVNFPDKLNGYIGQKAKE